MLIVFRCRNIPKTRGHFCPNYPALGPVFVLFPQRREEVLVKQLNRPRVTGCVRFVGLAAAYLLISRTMHAIPCFDGRTHTRLILDCLSSLAPTFSRPPFRSVPLGRRNVFLRGRAQLNARVWSSVSSSWGVQPI